MLAPSSLAGEQRDDVKSQTRAHVSCGIGRRYGKNPVRLGGWGVVLSALEFYLVVSLSAAWRFSPCPQNYCASASHEQGERIPDSSTAQDSRCSKGLKMPPDFRLLFCTCCEVESVLLSSSSAQRMLAARNRVWYEQKELGKVVTNTLRCHEAGKV